GKNSYRQQSRPAELGGGPASRFAQSEATKRDGDHLMGARRDPIHAEIVVHARKGRARFTRLSRRRALAEVPLLCARRIPGSLEAIGRAADERAVHGAEVTHAPRPHLRGFAGSEHDLPDRQVQRRAPPRVAAPLPTRLELADPHRAPRLLPFLAEEGEGSLLEEEGDAALVDLGEKLPARLYDEGQGLGPEQETLLAQQLEDEAAFARLQHPSQVLAARLSR